MVYDERKKNARKNLPCTADAAWHMGDIKSKQAIIIVCIARDAHAVSAGPIYYIGVVDTHVDKVVVGVYVAIFGCCCLIDVIHESGSRVGPLR